MFKRIILATAAAALIPAPAFAHQPYGGCDEAWQAPRSAGAEHCRDHGWTVRHRFVINPRGYVKYVSLPPCEYEDSYNCYWNAETSGNGGGDSFIIRGTEERHRIWYVNGFGR